MYFFDSLHALCVGENRKLKFARPPVGLPLPLRNTYTTSTVELIITLLIIPLFHWFSDFACQKVSLFYTTHTFWYISSTYKTLCWVCGNLFSVLHGKFDFLTCQSKLLSLSLGSWEISTIIALVNKYWVSTR